MVEGYGAVRRSVGCETGANASSYKSEVGACERRKPVAAGSGGARRHVGSACVGEQLGPSKLQRWDPHVWAISGRQWARALLSGMWEAKVEPNVISYGTGISARGKV